MAQARFQAKCAIFFTSCLRNLSEYLLESKIDNQIEQVHQKNVILTN